MVSYVAQNISAALLIRFRDVLLRDGLNKAAIPDRTRQSGQSSRCENKLFLYFISLFLLNYG